MPHDASLEPLHALWLSLFDSEGVRRFVAFGPDSEAVRAELPGLEASLSTLVLAALDALHRRGRLDLALLHRLSLVAPARREEILATRLPTRTQGGSVDLPRYLSLLLGEVDHIDINGISSRPGLSRTALRRPIEELYTPLCTHLANDATAAGPSERIELALLLRTHSRLLIEGAAGSGKSTFVKLVACMLARDRLAGDAAPAWRARWLGMDPTAAAPIPALVRMSLLVPLFAAYTTPGRPDDRAWLLDLLATRSSTAVTHAGAALDAREHARRCAAWDEWLRTGEALLLLDGLDEIADEALRQRVYLVLRDACESWPACKIVLTSRPLATDALRALDFHVVPVDPLGPPEIGRFVRQWAAALFDADNDRSAAHAHDILQAIVASPDLYHFAATPVLLTCLCVVHWNEGKLPQGRTRVYRAALNWMLQSRAEQRTRAGLSRSFAEYALTRLALAMMQAHGGKRATIGLPDAVEAIDPVARRKFPDLTGPERRALVRRWLLDECAWSHLIEEVADSQIRFWHLTMQEFAAALELALRDNGDTNSERDWWPVVLDHLHDPQWRETLEFLPACLHDEGGMRRVDSYFARVLATAPPSDLAAEAATIALVERHLFSLQSHEYTLPGPEQARLSAMHTSAAAIFTPAGAARVPVGVRIAAAPALLRRGAARPSSGPFLAIPGHTVQLAEFPVTVAEYAAFVADRGYAREDLWDPGGWMLRVQRGWVRPGDWERQASHPERPVVETSWFEAEAFCRWASLRHRAQLRLPTCAEWEAAASPDGRYTFPWGDAPPDPELANFNRTVGAPSAVGVYPGGVGPLGHHDLAGNVWEWCADGPPPGGERHGRGVSRWLKGGSWWQRDGDTLAACHRTTDRAGYRHFDRGFRLATDP